VASGSSGSSILPWFLGISALAVLTGGALTAAEAVAAEDNYQRARGRTAKAPRRAPPPRTPSSPSRIRELSRDILKAPKAAREPAAHAETVLKPVAAPGSVSPKPARVASPTAPPGAADGRLEGLLVGMGFKSAEARAAIAKLPPSVAKISLQDQLKAALAQLSK
jgi:hypothetical protein